MIHVAGLRKTFLSPGGEALTVLEDLTFDLAAGGSLAIQGPSGSGKSTLLAILAGLEAASAGTVTVAGQRLDTLSERARSAFRARTLGFVFQAFHLLPHFSALQNVVIGAEIAGIPEPLGRAREALDRVGLAERMGHLPGQLSGGECQRVAIARAMVTRPPILLCDEPTGSLDPRNADRVFELIMDLHRELGTTLVLVTHDLRLAPRMETCLHLERGRMASAEGLAVAP